VKKIWMVIGNILFWLTLPLLYIYLKRSDRTRVFLVHNNNVLVVKGWLSNGKWALPGGGLLSGEEPVKGALRELKEETGIQLSPQDLRIIGTRQHRENGLKFKYYLFVGELNEQLPAKSSQAEIVQTAWIAQDQLTGANAREPVIEALAAWRSRVK
jgi:8-oxo-dGTP pyrophosphatase MutT (NUDIX family)